MTILHTLADGTIPQRAALPEPTPATDVFGATDPSDDPVYAVVTVQIAMSRDMLAAALDMATANAEENPDTWSVEYVRESVELMLANESWVRAERDGRKYPRLIEDSSVGAYIRAIYRAVDRAYTGGTR
ncbi:hypothetical protein [Streptomyces sp. NPDC054849]